MSEKINKHTDICKSNNANKAIRGTMYSRTILSIADVREIFDIYTAMPRREH